MRTESELRAALEQLTAQAPAGDGALDGLEERADAARRRGLVLVAVAVVALVVAVVSTVTLLNPGRTVEPVSPPTSAANWTMSYRLDLPPNWQVSHEVIDRAGEQIAVRRSGSAKNASCEVSIDRSGSGVPPSGGRDRTLGGRAGTFLPATAGQQTHFWWRLDSGATAVLSCDGLDSPEQAVAEIVRGVMSDRHDIAIPFTLDALPPGQQVESVYGGAVDQLDGVEIGNRDVDDGTGRVSVYLWRLDPLRLTSDQGGPGRRITVAGRPAVFIAWSGSLCFEGRPTLCVGDTSAVDDPDADDSGPTELVSAIFSAIRPATDLSDRSTWPAAADALPR